jgi:hypothetical protein
MNDIEKIEFMKEHFVKEIEAEERRKSFESIPVVL